MYAGAASLAVSLWEVDDAATPELMSRFYKGLLGSDHLRPAAALRAAQLSIMKKGGWDVTRIIGHRLSWKGSGGRAGTRRARRASLFPLVTFVAFS